MTKSCFVAFYSYKGGVGRTMALANTAYALADRGNRVVVVDMDLEAPSLDSFAELKPSTENARGLMELARAYAQTGVLPAIGEALHTTGELDGGGQIWILPAGVRGVAYTATLSELNWRCLNPERGTMPFVDGLRDGIAEAVQPHYVLVDARTGLSDVGGLSTHLLADEVVLVFNLTRPCLEGTVRAYHSMAAGHPARGGKAPRMVLLASPVPRGSDSMVSERVKRAAELMPLASGQGRGVLKVYYDPGLVLAETLAVKDPDGFEAARTYEKLRETLQRDNPDSVFTTVERAETARKVGRVEEAVGMIRHFVAEHTENAEGHEALGGLLLELGRGEEAIVELGRALELGPGLRRARLLLAQALLNEGRPEEARVHIEEGIRRHGSRRELLDLQRDVLNTLGETERANEAAARSIRAQLRERPALSMEGVSEEELMRAAADRDVGPFLEALAGSVSLVPDKKRSFSEWLLKGILAEDWRGEFVNVLRGEHEDLGLRLGPVHRDALQTRLRESNVNPRDPEAVLSLRDGSPSDLALLKWAALKSEGSAALDLWREASRLAPGDLQVHQNYIFSLVRAMPTVDLEAFAWMREALEVNERLLALEPDSAENLLRIVFIVVWLLGRTEGAEQARLAQLVQASLTRALTLPSREPHAYVSAGGGFVAVARSAAPQHAAGFLSTATALLNKANTITPHCADALLAQAHLLAGELDAAEQLLLEHLTHHPDEREALLSEPALQPLFEARPELRARLGPT